MIRSTMPFILLVTLVFSACEDKADKVKALKDEVMDVHDEVMPLMGELRKTAKSLEMKAETLDSLSAAELNVLSANIDSANEFMMEWMRQYEPDLQGTEEELLEYYSAQRESIRMVNDSMMSTLKKGREAL